MSATLASLGALLLLLFAAILFDALRNASSSRSLPVFSFGVAVVLTAGLAALAGTSAVLGGSIERLTGSASQAVSASSVVIVFAVVGAVPSHVLGGVLDHVGFVEFLGLLIWIVVAAFLMTRPSRAV